jgi:hypothetical protein
MSRSRLLLALLVLMSPALGAQQQGSAVKPAPRIEDNSFLVEEAYNQEEGVVQHVSTFQRTRLGSWAYSFTQEWPAPGQKHQFSYTVPVLHLAGATGVTTGIGDLGLNYRYQMLGGEGERIWFSPRVSFYLPTGDELNGRGTGGPGLEFNLPVSYALSDAIVTHWNAGGSVTQVNMEPGVRGSIRGRRAAASAIWLFRPTLNFMLESVATRNESLDTFSRRVSVTSYVVSPGVRGAINFASGLQVVPGIAVPIGVGPSSGQRDVFVYLSLEHSFY